MGDGAPGREAVERRFSFACFPLERVLVLIGLMVGVSIAAGVVWQVRQMETMAGTEVGAIVFEPGHARLFAGLTVTVAVVLALYGVVYLQLRAATRATVTDQGVTWERAPVLPFGWLAGRREVRWTDARRVELRHRRTWLAGRQPRLEIDGAGARLRLNVADAWPDDGSRRPWVPRQPRAGWSQHPLVAAAMEAYAAALRVDTLKSDDPSADPLS